MCFEPAEAGFGVAGRFVFAADRTGVADAVEVREQERVVDLARARLIAARVVCQLDVGDAREVLAHRRREFAFHALAIIDEVGADNLYLQYDIYHMQRMEGELAATMAKHLARIAHIQLADNPGRNEPGTGEINYPFLFAHLDRIGYRGAIGCEYKPAGNTEAGLGWFAQARAA